MRLREHGGRPHGGAGRFSTLGKSAMFSYLFLEFQILSLEGILILGQSQRDATAEWTLVLAVLGLIVSTLAIGLPAVFLLGRMAAGLANLSSRFADVEKQVALIAKAENDHARDCDTDRALIRQRMDSWLVRQGAPPTPTAEQIRRGD